MPFLGVYYKCFCYLVGAGIEPKISYNQYFIKKTRTKKEVVTFVTTCNSERKTGLKPATPSLEG